MSQYVSSLLTEQQRVVSALRQICSNIVDLVAQTTDPVNKKKSYRKIFFKNRSDMTSIFLKISNLLLKVIPLEHCLYGVILSKTLNEVHALEENSNTNNIISDEDMNIIRRFYDDHI